MYLGQPTETTEPTVVSENVDNVFTEFNFDDEFSSQAKLNNPKLTRFQKHQARHEHTEEKLTQKAGLGISLLPNYMNYRKVILHLRNLERELVKEVVLSKIVCATISGHLAVS